MDWLLILVVGAGLAVVVRFYVSVRKGQRAKQAADWDTRLVKQLRARGSDPFQPHTVDFFFALPNEESCAAVNQQLEKEGYRVDVKAMPEDSQYPFSLHASKAMRVNVPDMRELSRRFGELALAHGGRYDGWGSD